MKNKTSMKSSSNFLLLAVVFLVLFNPVTSKAQSSPDVGCTEKTVYVNKVVDSGIPVSAGDRIYFTASGSLTFRASSLFGYTDYSGGANGMDFCQLEMDDVDEDGEEYSYCADTGGYFKREALGMLLAKVDYLKPGIQWDDDTIAGWVRGTEYIEFTTIRNGFLLFNLNNKLQKDIKGTITVKAKVCKKSNSSASTTQTNQTASTANQNTTTAKSRLPDALANTYWIDSGGFTSLKLNKDGTAEMKSVFEKEIFTGSYSIILGMALIKLNRAEIVGKFTGNKMALFVKYLDGKERKDASGKPYTEENLSMEKYVEKSSSGNSQKDSSNRSRLSRRSEKSISEAPDESNK